MEQIRHVESLGPMCICYGCVRERAKPEYSCGSCGKAIPGGCYCSSACAAAEDEESPENGNGKP